MKMRSLQTVNLRYRNISFIYVAVSTCKDMLFFLYFPLNVYLVAQFTAQGQIWTALLTFVSVRRRVSSFIIRQLQMYTSQVSPLV